MKRVVILDFGAQYAQLIARRVREWGVPAEIVDGQTPFAQILALTPAALILSGGPRSVREPEAAFPDPALWTAGVPMLGICYGMQLMAHALGGRVARSPAGESGRTPVRLRSSPLFVGLGQEIVTWMSHADRIEALPPGFTASAASEATAAAAMDDGGLRHAVQFHPEVRETPDGARILGNFLGRVAGLQPGRSVRDFVAESVEAVRAQMPTGDAICALSGGVDSAVAAAIVARAVGERLHLVFVDHGLMRKGEAESVGAALSEALGLPVTTLRCAERFLSALEGVEDPEVKRKVIGETFIRVFEAHAERLPAARYLVQGTLYPDVVESGGQRAAVIKSHHNVGGLPDNMRLALVEPLRALFKDEVRAVGRQLGLEDVIVDRVPFPGPGLAIRVMGALTPQRLHRLREADAIVREELERVNEPPLWQYFAVLLGTRSVGVVGDQRTYAETVAVRAVTSTDGMTADWARLDFGVLERLATRLTAEVAGVGRVVYDITSKPPGTIEWE